MRSAQSPSEGFSLVAFALDSLGGEHRLELLFAEVFESHRLKQWWWCEVEGQKEERREDFATLEPPTSLKMLETVRSRQIYGFAVLTILPGTLPPPPLFPLPSFPSSSLTVHPASPSLRRSGLLPPKSRGRPHHPLGRCHRRFRLYTSTGRSRRGGGREGGEGTNRGAQEEGDGA